MPLLMDRMRRGAFILGDDVGVFETALASFTGTAYCVGVGNGTDAIELAAQAVGLEPGDEVVLPTNSFIATAAAVVRARGVPCLVDCDSDSHLVSVPAIAAAISSRTRLVIPVHLYGQMAEMDCIATVTAQHGGIAVIEDAAQSHGATRHGRPSGSWGDAAATSFYPSKNLGAYGDAGAVLTSREDIAALVRRLRDHGGLDKYRHDIVGTNSRLDALQAVVLSAKLARLGAWNELRTLAAERYSEALADHAGVSIPHVVDGNVHVWHLYVVRVAERDAVAARMRDAGIDVGIHYPIPIHLQPAMRFLGHGRGDFPNAEKAADEVLSLPIFPGITAAQQDRVIAALLASLP